MRKYLVLRSIGVILLIASHLQLLCQEICDNGINDDPDNLTDLNDPECQCDAAGPDGSFNIVALGSGGDCEEIVLSVPDVYLFAEPFQWYLDNRALKDQTSQELELYSGSPSGEYRIRLYDKGECFISVPFVFNSSVDAEILQAGRVCQGTTASLNVITPARFYIWDTGESTRSILVNRPGEYRVTIVPEGQANDECNSIGIVVVEEDCNCTSQIDTSNLLRNSGFESRSGCCTVIETLSDFCIEEWVYLNGLNIYLNPADIERQECGTDLLPLSNRGFFTLSGNAFAAMIIRDDVNQLDASALGQCLNTPLLSSKKYDISLDVARDDYAIPGLAPGFLQISLYAIENCADLSNLEQLSFCEFIQRPEINSTPLLTIDVTDMDKFQWKTLEFEITSSAYYEAIVIAPNCELQNTGNWDELIFIDNIVIEEFREQSTIDIIEIFNNCNQGISLTADDPNFNIYYWKSGDSLISINDTLSLSVDDIPKAGITLQLENDRGSCVEIGPLLFPVQENLFKDSIILCPSDLPLIWRDITIQTAGLYTDSLLNDKDCYDRYELEVSLIDNTALTESLLVCEGEYVTIDGVDYNDDTTFVKTITDSLPCDILITYFITKIPPAIRSITDTVCEGQSFFFNNQLITKEGIYSDTLPGELCDSIIHLNLSIRKADILIEPITLCQDEVFIIGQDTITEDTIYVDTLIHSNGCFDLIEYEIVYPEYDTFTSLAVNLDTISFFLYDGDTLSDSGIYRFMEINDLGCPTILEIIIEKSDIPIPSGPYIPNVFSPNGDSVNDIFVVINSSDFPITRGSIYDRWGSEIYSISRLEVSTNFEWSGFIKGQRASSGVYVVLLQIGDSTLARSFLLL